MTSKENFGVDYFLLFEVELSAQVFDLNFFFLEGVSVWLFDFLEPLLELVGARLVLWALGDFLLVLLDELILLLQQSFQLVDAILKFISWIF